MEAARRRDPSAANNNDDSLRPKTESTVPRMEDQYANESLNESIGTRQDYVIFLGISEQAAAKLSASKTDIRSSSGIHRFRTGGRNGCNSGNRSARKRARPYFVLVCGSGPMAPISR